MGLVSEQNAASVIDAPPADWLSHLRTDRRGLPVPYVNVWGDEASLPVRLEYDVNVRARAVFTDDAGQSVPDFTRQCMQRQRECMVQGLCQVCARPVPWSSRFLVVSSISVEQIELKGGRAPVVIEPWLCARCAHIATRRCPALIRRTTADDLHLIPVTSKRQVKLISSVGWVEGALEQETKADPPVMWLKLALPGVNISWKSP